MSLKTDRTAETLRSALGEILRRDVADPRLRLASISQVRVSADLRQARVLVSVLGTDEERGDAIAALDRARGFVRRQLARRADLRSTPELVFELDRGAEHSQRITELLENLDRDHDRT